MSTHFSTDAQDLQAVFGAIASGKPVDPEVAQRVHERAEAIRDEVYRKHGLLNVAVDLVRAGRDEE